MLRCLEWRLKGSNRNQADDVGDTIDVSIDLADNGVRLAGISNIECKVFAVSLAAQVVRRPLVGDPHTGHGIAHVSKLHRRVRRILARGLRDDIPNAIRYLLGGHVRRGWSRW